MGCLRLGFSPAAPAGAVGTSQRRHFVASFVGNFVAFVESNRVIHASARGGVGANRLRHNSVVSQKMVKEVRKFGSSKVWALACTEAPRPPRRHKLTVQQPEGRARRPRHAAMRCDRRAAHKTPYSQPAHSATYPPLRELPQSGADIPVCAGLRGQTEMSAPHYHTPSLRLAGTASPHLCWRALAGASPALHDNRRQSTTACIWQTDAYSMTMSRPYRASLFFDLYPGRCPGLVYRAPSGLSSALAQAAPVTGHGGPVPLE